MNRLTSTKETQPLKLTIARYQTARKYARIMDALSRAARKKSKDDAHYWRALNNVQTVLMPETLRLVAGNGFTLAIVDLPIQPDQNVPDPLPDPALLPAQDVLNVARDLKRGGVYAPHLSLEIEGDNLTLVSAHGDTRATSTGETTFPRWRDYIPAVAEDEGCSRTALDPDLLILAAKLCSEIEGHMMFTAVGKNTPVRIDCVAKTHNLERPPRAVVSIMPIYARWDDPAAIDLHDDPDPEPGEPSADQPDGED